MSSLDWCVNLFMKLWMTLCMKLWTELLLLTVVDDACFDASRGTELGTPVQLTHAGLNVGVEVGETLFRRSSKNVGLPDGAQCTGAAVGGAVLGRAGSGMTMGLHAAADIELSPVCWSTHCSVNPQLLVLLCHSQPSALVCERV